MSDDLIARARAALDGVTPGPWDDVLCHYRRHDMTPKNNAINARFIAAARSLVPEMADALEKQAKEIERLKMLMANMVPLSVDGKSVFIDGIGIVPICYELKE